MRYTHRNSTNDLVFFWGGGGFRGLSNGITENICLSISPMAAATRLCLQIPGRCLMTAAKLSYLERRGSSSSVSLPALRDHPCQCDKETGWIWQDKSSAGRRAVYMASGGGEEGLVEMVLPVRAVHLCKNIFGAQQFVRIIFLLYVQKVDYR